MPEDSIKEILTRLGRMEGKQDLILTSQNRQEAVLVKHEERLTSVERYQSRTLGWAAGVAGTFSLLAGYLFGK